MGLLVCAEPLMRPVASPTNDMLRPPRRSTPRQEGVVVVIGLDDSQGDVELVEKRVVGAQHGGLATIRLLSANDARGPFSGGIYDRSDLCHSSWWSPWPGGCTYHRCCFQTDSSCSFCAERMGALSCGLPQFMWYAGREQFKNAKKGAAAVKPRRA